MCSRAELLVGFVVLALGGCDLVFPLEGSTDPPGDGSVAEAPIIQGIEPTFPILGGLPNPVTIRGVAEPRRTVHVRFTADIGTFQPEPEEVEADEQGAFTAVVQWRPPALATRGTLFGAASYDTAFPEPVEKAVEVVLALGPYEPLATTVNLVAGTIYAVPIAVPVSGVPAIGFHVVNPAGGTALVGLYHAAAPGGPPGGLAAQGGTPIAIGRNEVTLMPSGGSAVIDGGPYWIALVFSSPVTVDGVISTGALSALHDGPMLPMVFPGSSASSVVPTAYLVLHPP